MFVKKSYDHSFCSDNEVHCQNIWYDRSLALKTSDLLELPYDRDRLDLGRKEKNACLPPYILFIALFPTLCFKFLYKVRSSNKEIHLTKALNLGHSPLYGRN